MTIFYEEQRLKIHDLIIKWEDESSHIVHRVGLMNYYQIKIKTIPTVHILNDICVIFIVLSSDLA